MSDHAPTKTMSVLAALFGASAILLPLVRISTLTAAAAVTTAVAGVVLFRLVAAEMRGTSVAVLVVAPLFGGGVLASTVVHVDIAAVVESGLPSDVVPVAAGSVAGVVGATALVALCVGSLGHLSVPTANNVFSSVTRVSGLLLTATAVSAGVLRFGSSLSLPSSPLTVLIELGETDPGVLSIVVFTLMAFLGPFALWMSTRVQQLVTSPIDPVTVHTASADSNPESPEEADTAASEADNWPVSVRRVVVWLAFASLALGFVRPVLAAGVELLSGPRAEQLLALNEAITAVVTTPTTLRLLVWSIGLLLAVYVGTAVISWARKRIDRSSSVFGTGETLAVVVAGSSILIYVLQPVYEPLVATQIQGSTVPDTIAVTVLELLPAVILSGILIACVLGLGLLVVLVTYGSLVVDTTEGLVYRNFVFLCTMLAIIAAAVYGVMAAMIFASVVAALIAWDFLEYGYTIAVELDSRSLQPPEIAHAAASVGMGVALVVASIGAYELGRTVTPPTELSYVALPALVLAATLLILYFAE